MTGGKATGSQVELIGPVGGAFCFALAACLVLTGPTLALTGESLWGAVCPALVTLPIGIALAVETYRWRRNARRFRTAAIRAEAEIIAVRIRPGGENPDVAELRVRISGPGFEPFVAECEVPTGVPHPRAGDRRRVLVDPADRRFAIGADHLHDEG
ncbi:hypothetical protein [Nocardia asteroides]|uniref:hypothetical protein n=1 Tax=Nocardia asteroides TaxID=1824 RepID=UPI001E450981|nr:hypothetical protein [Nocardia asteroides]UGT62593.1 hypothetical protein LTT61_04405 [Nocardia asteroides]